MTDSLLSRLLASGTPTPAALQGAPTPAPGAPVPTEPAQPDAQLYDEWIESLRQRGYVLHFDVRAGRPRFFGQPHNENPITDQDRMMRDRYASHFMAKTLEQQDVPVEEPLESSFLNVLPGMAMGVAGAEAGGQLAGRLAPQALRPLAAAAGRVGGATAGVYGAENLPQEMGGVEEPSLARSLTYGALQEIVPGAGTLMSRKAIRAGEKNVVAKEHEYQKAYAQEARAANVQLREAARDEEVAQNALNKLQDKARLQAATRYGARGIRDLLAQGVGPAPIAATSAPARPVKEAYQKAATTWRHQVGEPLEEAYAALKADPWTTPNVEHIAERATEIEAATRGYVSPSARRWLDAARELADAKTPPTLDQVREFRQKLTHGLKTLEAASHNRIAELREAVDDVLAPYLPADIRQLRAAYVDVLDVIPYKADRAVWRSVDSAGVAKRTFETPQRALGILEHIDNPQDLRYMQNAFADSILSKVNLSDTADKQLAALSKAMQYWRDTGVLDRVYPNRNVRGELTNLMQAPRNVHNFRAAIADPNYGPGFRREFNDFLATPEGQEMERDVTAGFSRLRDAVSATAEGKKRIAQLPSFTGGIPRGREAFVEGASEHLMGGIETMKGLKHRAAHHLLWAAMGGMPTMYFYGAMSRPSMYTAGGIIGANVLWDAAMNAGGAQILANLLADSSKRAAARNFARLLAAIGTAPMHRSQALEEAQEAPAAGPALGMPEAVPGLLEQGAPSDPSEISRYAPSSAQ